MSSSVILRSAAAAGTFAMLAALAWPAATSRAGADAAVARPAVHLALSAGHYVTAPAGNEARYLVREQLARLEFPNDAVGRTSSVRGAVVIGEDGAIDRSRSRFVVDLVSLRSDNDRRDNYVRRNTLRTYANPEAVFVPTAVSGLSQPLPSAGEHTVRITGDLTINGVTRPTTWEATVRAEGDAFRGTARTEFTFGDFRMTIPRVAAVLSVTDRIRLEYDFHLVPAGTD
jgi:polyisoprenoid-binding protein YceI